MNVTPSTQKMETGRIMAPGQARQKLASPCFKTSWVLSSIPVIPATLEMEVGGLWFEASLGSVSNETLSEKQLKDTLKGLRARLKC
jgi:hypothetical protein